MPKREPAPKAFTYLFDSNARAVPFERLDDEIVELRLRHPLNRAVLQPHRLPVDRRDQRVLVVFDGDIPWQGAPKGADEALSVDFGEVMRPSRVVRKDRSFEEPLPPGLRRDEEGNVWARLVRHFLLVPASTLLVRRYCSNNLTARYALVEVKWTTTGAVDVIWRNSSY